jgi:hypothetical protein
MSDSKAARIRARAYQLWEKAGRPAGADVTHWLIAEAELTTGVAQDDEPMSDRSGSNTPARARDAARNKAGSKNEWFKPARVESW